MGVKRIIIGGLACTGMALLGYRSGPETQEPTRNAVPQETWSVLPTHLQAVRIPPPAETQAPGWPALRDRLVGGSSDDDAHLLSEIWERVPSANREVWLKAALTRWVAATPESALSQMRAWNPKSPLGQWLKKSGVNFAFDRWARADARAALAYIRDHEVLGIRLGNALSQAPIDDYVAIMSNGSRGLGDQEHMLAALAKNDPERAFKLLGTISGSVSGYGGEEHILVRTLAKRDPVRTIIMLQSRSGDPNKDSVTHRVYLLWAAENLKAALAHHKQQHPERSQEQLIAHAHAHKGVPAIMKALADHRVEGVTNEIFGSLASALGRHPMPVDEVIPIIDGLVHGGYDPLHDSSRYHDRFPGFKRNLNANHWPPDGEESALFEELLALPQGNARDALLGAIVSKIGESDLDLAANMAMEAAGNGALWVAEGLQRKLRHRLDLKLAIARSLRGVQLYHFSRDLQSDIFDDPARLAGAITQMGDDHVAPPLTWHLMGIWHRLDPQKAETWLAGQSHRIQTAGRAALARHRESRDHEATARLLMTVKEPFWAHDNTLRGALRTWAKRGDPNQVEQAIQEATHYSKAYRQQLIDYALLRKSYRFHE